MFESQRKRDEHPAQEQAERMGDEGASFHCLVSVGNSPHGVITWQDGGGFVGGFWSERCPLLELSLEDAEVVIEGVVGASLEVGLKGFQPLDKPAGSGVIKVSGLQEGGDGVRIVCPDHSAEVGEGAGGVGGQRTGWQASASPLDGLVWVVGSEVSEDFAQFLIGEGVAHAARHGIRNFVGRDLSFCEELGIVLLEIKMVIQSWWGRGRRLGLGLRVVVVEELRSEGELIKLTSFLHRECASPGFLLKFTPQFLGDVQLLLQERGAKVLGPCVVGEPVGSSGEAVEEVELFVAGHLIGDERGGGRPIVGNPCVEKLIYQALVVLSLELLKGLGQGFQVIVGGEAMSKTVEHRAAKIFGPVLVGGLGDEFAGGNPAEDRAVFIAGTEIPSAPVFANGDGIEGGAWVAAIPLEEDGPAGIFVVGNEGLEKNGAQILDGLVLFCQSE